jgi:uncharacterized protein (TIGR02186 family)
VIAPVAAAPPPPADQPFVAAALTETEVRVNSAFRGASMVLYGAVYDPAAEPPDVVVVVRGPEQPVRLIRKVHVAGLWLNSRPVVFEGAPGFYMAASTRPLTEIANFGTLRRLGLGVNHLQFDAPAEERVETRYGVRDVVVSRLGEDYLDWRRAVIRLKEKANLYDVDPQGVTFVDRGLFRAEVVLPAQAPIGRYETQVWLFKDGQPVSVRTREITVEKVGFERWLYRFAYDLPWLYGLLSVAIAVVSGWGASVVFRRS